MAKDKSKKTNLKSSYNSGNINYPVGDFLIRLKNACLAQRKTVSVKQSNLINEVANTLQKEGYLDEVKKKDNYLEVRLRYAKKEPVLTNVILVSKPGLRIYKTREDIENLRGPQILIISSSHGVMSSRDALKKGVGGEVIAEIL